MRMDSDVWAGRWGVDGEGRGGNDGTVDWKYLKYSTLRYIIVRYLYTIHLYTLTLIHLYKYSFIQRLGRSTRRYIGTALRGALDSHSYLLFVVCM